jgi:hypothetical protein
MDNVVEVAEYAAYVNEAVADFYGPSDQTELKLPGDEGITARFTNPVDGASITYIPASAGSGTSTNLPTPLGSDTQQLRARRQTGERSGAHKRPVGHTQRQCWNRSY